MSGWSVLALAVLLCVEVCHSGVAPVTGIHGAAKRNELGELRRLLDRGVNVNKVTQGQITALMWAAAEGHVEAAQMLISAGADTAPKSSLGADALQLARQSISDPTVLSEMEVVLTGKKAQTSGQDAPVDASKWDKASSTCSGDPASTDSPTVEDMAAGGHQAAHAAREPAAQNDPTDPFSKALRDLHLNEADRVLLDAELVTDVATLMALSEDDLTSIGIPALQQRRARSDASQASGP